MYTVVSDEIVAKWEKKRDKCLKLLDEETNARKHSRQLMA